MAPGARRRAAPRRPPTTRQTSPERRRNAQKFATQITLVPVQLYFRNIYMYVLLNFLFRRVRQQQRGARFVILSLAAATYGRARAGWWRANSHNANRDSYIESRTVPLSFPKFAGQVLPTSQSMTANDLIKITTVVLKTKKKIAQITVMRILLNFCQFSMTTLEQTVSPTCRLTCQSCQRGTHTTCSSISPAHCC